MNKRSRCGTDKYKINFRFTKNSLREIAKKEKGINAVRKAPII